MTLRRRLALLSAAAVALAVVLASALVYVLVRDSLRDNVDDDLRGQVEQAEARLGEFEQRSQQAPSRPARLRRSSAGARAAAAESHSPAGRPAAGRLTAPTRAPAMPPRSASSSTQRATDASAGRHRPDPVSSEARELAANGGDPSFEDVEADDAPLRVLTQPLAGGVALQVAASLQETEDTLSTLVLISCWSSIGGIALAAALGPVVARTALAPAGRGLRRGPGGRADPRPDAADRGPRRRRARPAGSSFNEMMAALERSEASQRRLVADASHELRTPLACCAPTSRRSSGSRDMTDDERGRLIADVTDELEELTALVADVVELAREPGAEAIVIQDVAMDELARDAIERARRRFRGLHVRGEHLPRLVTGDPQRLGRAISNLLDNAAKWSPDGGTVEVTSSGGRVSVRDHGPGFAPAELPKVFDRFWRSDEARGKHGSGLGLAIVQRVAEEHGGSASAANAGGGGAVVTHRAASKTFLSRASASSQLRLAEWPRSR